MFGALRAAKEVAGAVGTLIALPAALFGLYVFSDEIYDSFTSPDVGIEVESLTLRCFYRFQDPESYARFTGGDAEVFVENCDAAPLSVSFDFEITNEDRIGRTVTGVSVALTLPAPMAEAPIMFTRTWEVAHEIQGAAETNIRRVWYTVELSPLRTTKHEVWIEQQGPELKSLQWGAVRRWLSDVVDPPAGAPIEAKIFLELVGVAEPRHVATCRFPLKADALERYRSLPALRQLRFTALCET